MTCLDCQNIVSRNSAMTRNGYSGCKNNPEWEFRAATRERECDGFLKVSEDVAETRKAWLLK